MAKDKEVQLKEIELEKEKVSQSTKIWEKALEEGFPLLKEYLNKKIEKLEVPKIRLSLIWFSIILFVVILITSFLVYAGKLEGSNLTFLLGIMVGAIITFLSSSNGLLRCRGSLSKTSSKS